MCKVQDTFKRVHFLLFFVSTYFKIFFFILEILLCSPRFVLQRVQGDKKSCSTSCHLPALVSCTLPVKSTCAGIVNH